MGSMVYRIRCLLATVRVANMPSILSNVAAGVVASSFADGACCVWGVHYWQAVTVGVLLYAAGNFLNDWWDVAWDRQYRPERALPCGVFPEWLYGVCGFGLMLISLVLAFCVGSAVFWVAIMISLGVLLYTFWHKTRVISVWVMGGCRAALVLLGASAATGVVGQWSGCVIGVSLALGLYIVGLSLLARGESNGQSLGGVARLFRWVLLGLPVIYGLMGQWPFVGYWFASGVYGLWMGYARMGDWRNKGVHVGRLLAGIPLVDGLLLVPVGLSCWLGGGTVDGLVLAALPCLCLALGWTLQRVAPAT